MQEYTQSGGVRPFGVSLLVAGMDGDGVPRLFQVDPSGAYFGWKATAIGKVRKTRENTHWHYYFMTHYIIPPIAISSTQNHQHRCIIHNLIINLIDKNNQGYVNANNFLEKRYQDDMELEDAIHTALLTLREGFEGEMNGHNIEVGVVSKADGKFRLLNPEQIQDYLDEAN